MLTTVLQRFPIQRVILVADRGLISLENIGELSALAEQARGGRTLEFILAVPARRYGEMSPATRVSPTSSAASASSNPTSRSRRSTTGCQIASVPTP